ncbi:HAD family phosphatase [Dactylosporangium sp. NPDC005572]|uniref:HAD family hydrolase n=1 Tax=Dactylosporangium sp. NPDC005572 TaxID=3156889 RepID=UPI0033BD5F58
MTGGRLSAVAFDLDGTLVDLERFHHEALLRAAREAGVELTWDQALERLPHFIGGPDQRVAAEVAALSPAGVPPVEVLAAKRRYFASLIGEVAEIVPRAGVGEFLDRLAGRGIPVAVGTVTERGTALGILHRAGLLPRFGERRVVTAQDVPHLKPAPHVYRETARRLGVEAADQLVFEDSLTGMAAARSAGSPVVAMPTVHDPDYLAAVAAAGASAVFPGWRDPGLLPLLDRLLVPGGGERRGHAVRLAPNVSDSFHEEACLPCMNAIAAR